jgi:DNA ligase (NAD+)
MQDRIAELRISLMMYNKAYREGKPLISDSIYDALVEELETLSPEDDFFNEIGVKIADDDPRKQKLPITMASMHKNKTLVAIYKWAKKVGIPLDTWVTLSAKLDGMAFTLDELPKWGWTRGDGIFGQRSDEHYAYMCTSEENQIVMPNGVNPFAGMTTFGEVIMKRSIFEKYADEYENPRNLVSGIINSKDVTEKLVDVDYIRYGIGINNSDIQFTKKSEQLAYLNQFQKNKIRYTTVKLSDLTEEYLKGLFMEWNKEYELDGIIIEVDDLELQRRIGRERNSNPAYARAYKGNFEEVKDTPYLGYTIQVSKQGFFSPIAQVEPVRLDGVTVSNVTLNNMRNMVKMKIGKGSILKIKRSGMVIPLIMENLSPSDEIELPTCCPACKSEDIGWNETNVHMMCFNEDCVGQRLQKIIAFFSILGVENVSEGVCTQFYDAGFDTIHKIMTMTQADMEQLDRFGKRKAEIVYKSIHSKMKAVALSKLQHATGFFKGLGSKKLALLEQFETKPTAADITALEGFSDISANAYLAAYDKFYDFIQGLPIQIEKTAAPVIVSNALNSASFCFTGVRRTDLEAEIISRGGKIASGVSKTLTYLVMKEKGSGSSKETKAMDLGVTILTVEDLEALLNG